MLSLCLNARMGRIYLIGAAALALFNMAATEPVYAARNTSKDKTEVKQKVKKDKDGGIVLTQTSIPSMTVSAIPLLPQKIQYTVINTSPSGTIYNLTNIYFPNGSDDDVFKVTFSLPNWGYEFFPEITHCYSNGTALPSGGQKGFTLWTDPACSTYVHKYVTANSDGAGPFTPVQVLAFGDPLTTPTTLEGAISDQAGSPVPYAQMRITNISTGEVQTTNADLNGKYAITFAQQPQDGNLVIVQGKTAGGQWGGKQVNPFYVGENWFVDFQTKYSTANQGDANFDTFVDNNEMRDTATLEAFPGAATNPAYAQQLIASDANMDGIISESEMEIVAATNGLDVLGRVTNSIGEGIANVSVTAYPVFSSPGVCNSSPRINPASTSTTNAFGYFALGGDGITRPGTYFVEADNGGSVRTAILVVHGGDSWIPSSFSY